MSSINKSGTRFVPKVKQRKRPGLADAAKKTQETPKKHLPTPQATQATQPSVSPPEQTQQPAEEDKSFEDGPVSKQTQVTTPASPISQSVPAVIKSTISQIPQVQITPSKSQADDNNKSVDLLLKPSTEPTPGIKSRRDSTTSIASTRTDFIAPSIKLRRDSENKNRTPSITTTRSINLTAPSSRSLEAVNATAAYQRQRRLSSLSSDGPATGGARSRRASSVSGGISGSIGVLPPIFGPRSRRGSTTSALESEGENGEPGPVRIGIPLSIPQKRRRSSVGNTSGKRRRRRRQSVNVGPSVMEESDEDDVRTESDKPVGGKPVVKKTIRFQEPSSIGAITRRRNSDSENADPLVDDTANKVKNRELVNTEKIRTEITEDEKLAKARYYPDPTSGRLVKLEAEEEEGLREVPNVSVVIDHMKSITKISRSENHKLLEKFVINDDTMTLAELTKRTIPFGKVSKSYEQAIEGDNLRDQKRIERKLLRERARRERVNPDKLLGDDEDAKEKERAEQTKQLLNEDREERRGQHNVIQLQYDETGHITYNSESTVIDRHSSNFDSESRERVVENPYENPVTSATYSKRRVTERWKAQEVAELYKALSTWGTDFGLIAQLFPYRTRKQIKAKFLSEERARPHLIEFALLRKLPGNLDEYTGKTGKDFKSLDEYEKELKDLKVKHDKEIKEMAAAKERAKVEDTHKAKIAYESSTSTVTRVSAKSRKAVLLEFRKNEEVVGTIDGKK